MTDRESAPPRMRIDLAGLKAHAAELAETSKGALQGRRDIRALEVYVADVLKARYPTVVVPAWGGKERGQARDLLKRYQYAEVTRLVEFAVDRWAMLRRHRLNDWLPPVPTFHAIYAARDQLASHMASERRPATKPVEPPEPPAVPRAEGEPVSAATPEPVHSPAAIKEAFRRGGVRGLRELMKTKPGDASE